ncbi:MAG TPA: PLP-dependent aspartate aminotransferase family protein, partial [Thermoanaerobaculia bacterium]|nr:PLP-dependent aspartate aminotransferase family protein [Thermoanaerobaculia bacterium]
TYVQDGLGEHKGYEYARGQNPTRSALEANVAALERGVAAQAFASGMAAIAALLSVVRSGERVVASRTVYGGTYRFFTRVLDRAGIEFEWIDSSDLEAVRGAVDGRTRLVYLESPTNPLMEICDIRGIAGIAHRAGALVAVDNTFLSPYLQRPLELGADVVVHSATKFLNGHSDCLGGLLVTADSELADWFTFVQKSAGGILGPFDSFLVLRGIKTLAVRMERHEANARAIAQYLAEHPLVRRVLYPGLADHPGHELHKRQADGFGGVLTLDLGGLPAAKAFLEALRVMSLAESLGGVETLASHPASMTHASMPLAEREALGITDGLVRISVGIEDLKDLLGDLDRALTAAGRHQG